MFTEKALTALQRDDLRAVAAMIVPASAEYDVPGADDAAIQADMTATLGRDTPMVREALDHLARLAGKPLADLQGDMAWSRATGRCWIPSMRGLRCGAVCREL